MSRINEQCLWTLYMMFDPIQNTASRYTLLLSYMCFTDCRCASSSMAVTGAWHGVICASRPRDSLGGTFSLAGEIAGSVGPRSRLRLRQRATASAAQGGVNESTPARRRITRAGCDTHDAMVVGGVCSLSFALSLCPHADAPP